MNNDWRKALQAELDANNRLRETSIYRVGDHLTETKAHDEGAGRAREVKR